MRRVDDVGGLNRAWIFFSSLSLARRRFTGENQTSFSDSSLTLISVSAAHYRAPPTSPPSYLLPALRHAATPDMTIHHGDLRRRRRRKKKKLLPRRRRRRQPRDN